MKFQNKPQLYHFNIIISPSYIYDSVIVNLIQLTNEHQATTKNE